MSKDGLNQFGDPLARAIRIRAYVVKCSECGAIMPFGPDGYPPVRCSNRESCGRMFHDVIPVLIRRGNSHDETPNPKRSSRST